MSARLATERLAGPSMRSAARAIVHGYIDTAIAAVVSTADVSVGFKPKAKAHTAKKADRATVRSAKKAAAPPTTTAQLRLGRACYGGGEARVREALAAGADANAAVFQVERGRVVLTTTGGRRGMTAVAVAAQNGRLGALSILAGVGSTEAAQLLMCAASLRGDVVRVREALAAGADANAAVYTLKRGRVSTGGHSTAAAMVARKIKWDATCDSQHRYAPGHDSAARRGRLDALAVLAEAGSADAAPLLLGAACLGGDTVRVREALAAGADANAAVYTLESVFGNEVVGMAGDPSRCMTAAALAARRDGRWCGHDHDGVLTILANAGSTDAAAARRKNHTRAACCCCCVTGGAVSGSMPESGCGLWCCWASLDLCEIFV